MLPFPSSTKSSPFRASSQPPYVPPSTAFSTNITTILPTSSHRVSTTSSTSTWTSSSSMASPSWQPGSFPMTIWQLWNTANANFTPYFNPPLGRTRLSPSASRVGEESSGASTKSGQPEGREWKQRDFGEFETIGFFSERSITKVKGKQRVLGREFGKRN